MAYPQIVLCGDSLIQESVLLKESKDLAAFSLHAELQQLLIRRADVINRGFSGWSSTNLVKHLGDIFPEPTSASSRIEFLFILIGANDAALEGERQHVPIDEFKKNLVTIITHPGITAHDPKIVLITPPPVDEIKKQECDRQDGGRPLSRATANSAKYSEAVRQVARETPGIGLIDLHEALVNLATEMTVEDYVQVAAREYIEKALKGCDEAERPDLEKAARAKFDTTARHDVEEAARLELKSSAHPLGSFLNGKRGGFETLLPDGLHMNGDAYREFYKLIQASIRQGRANLEHDDKDDYVFPDWRVLNPVRK